MFDNNIYTNKRVKAISDNYLKTTTLMTNCMINQPTNKKVIKFHSKQDYF